MGALCADRGRPQPAAKQVKRACIVRAPAAWEPGTALRGFLRESSVKNREAIDRFGGLAVVKKSYLQESAVLARIR
jgi:hypothetical protein